MPAMLACTTPRGRDFIERQNMAIAYCACAWRCLGTRTPNDGTSPVDGLFSRAEALLAVAEVKSRDLTLAQLRELGSYLVTRTKLDAGREVARLLGVRYLLIVDLLDTVVYWELAGPTTAWKWQVPFALDTTTTAATCNGGTATRENAYLALSALRVVRLREGAA